MNEDELESRIISYSEIKTRAQDELKKGFHGKAVIAFIDLLGFSKTIKDQWNDPTQKPLETIMEIKSFLKIVFEKIKTIKFHEDDGTTLIREINYPKVITVSDSFMFVLPLDETSEETIICSILGVVIFTLELWKICIDKGYTIRGAIEYGDIYHNKLDIIGPAFIDVYNLESKEAKSSRIILSHNIKSIINENIDRLKSQILDYCLRFFYLDSDNFLCINPVMKLAHRPELAVENYQILEEIIGKIGDQKVVKKYTDLMRRIKEQNLEFQDRSIFETD